MAFLNDNWRGSNARQRAASYSEIAGRDKERAVEKAFARLRATFRRAELL